MESGYLKSVVGQIIKDNCQDEFKECAQCDLKWTHLLHRLKYELCMRELTSCVAKKSKSNWENKMKIPNDEPKTKLLDPFWAHDEIANNLNNAPSLQKICYMNLTTYQMEIWQKFAVE